MTAAVFFPPLLYFDVFINKPLADLFILLLVITMSLLRCIFVDSAFVFNYFQILLRNKFNLLGSSLSH